MIWNTSKFKRIFFPLCLRKRLKQKFSFVFVTLFTHISLAKTRLKGNRFLAQENTVGRKWTICDFLQMTYSRDISDMSKIG